MRDVAKGLGLEAGDDVARLSDEFVGSVVEAMAHSRPGRHGESWALLGEHRTKIGLFVAGDVPAVKMVELLARQGVAFDAVVGVLLGVVERVRILYLNGGLQRLGQIGDDFIGFAMSGQSFTEEFAGGRNVRAVARRRGR